MNRTRSQAIPVGWRSRRTRRVLVTGLLLVLMVWLVQLLFAPFQHPRTHLVLLTGGISENDSSGLGPSDFVVDDFADFLPLESALYRGALGPGLTVLGSLRSRDEMRILGDQIVSLPVAPHDVLLFYVNAAGLSRDGTPYLSVPSANFPPSEASRYPLRGLLRQVQSSPARHILIVLDAGRAEFDPARGMLVNQFPRLLREEVEQLKDARISVLCSHDEQQRSHLSYSLQRSVFSYFVSQGLLGSADENGDRVITLDELHQFVSQKVSAWVQQGTGENENQTPFLARWSGAPRNGSVSLLAVTYVDRQRIRDGHQINIDRNRRESRMATRATDSARRDASRFVRTQIDRVRPRSRFSSFAGSYAPGFWRELSAWFGGGTTPAGHFDDPGSDLEPDSDLEKHETKAADSAEGGTTRSAAPSAGPSIISGPVATSATAEASTPDATESASPTDSDSPDVERSSSVSAAEPSSGGTSGATPSSDGPPHDAVSLDAILAQAWRLRDELEQLPDAQLRPHDYAPHLWRALQGQLLQYERQFRTGPPESEAGLRRNLSRMVSELQMLAAMRTFPAAPADTLVRKIAAAHPSLSTSLTSMPSLALRELDSKRRNRPLPEELHALRDQFDNWQVAGTRADFVKWIDELPSSALELSEFRFAATLSSLGHLEWDQIQLALQVSRQAERSVVQGWRYINWLRPQTLLADQQWQQVEPSLRSGIGFDPDTARSQLLSALAAYEQIDHDRFQLEHATRLRNDLLIHVPNYLRWFQLTSASNSASAVPGPGFDELSSLIVDLAGLCDLLDSGNSDNRGEVYATVERLEIQQRRIVRPLSIEAIRILTTTPAQAGDSWQIEVLLATSLPRAEARRRLLESAAEIESAWASEFILPTQSPTPLSIRQLGPEEWQRIQQLATLEYQWLSLASFPTNAAPVITQSVERAKTSLATLVERSAGEIFAETDDESRRRALSAFQMSLQSFYQNLSDRLQNILDDNVELSDIATRPERARTLRQGLRLLALLDARDTTRFRTAQPHVPAEQVELYDLLDWLHQRVLMARIATDQEDVAFYTQLARQYAQGASLIPRQPSLPSILPSRLEFRGPSSLALALRQEEVVTLDLTSQLIQRTDSWLVLEYDDELLDIRSLSNGRLYRTDEVSSTAARWSTAVRRTGVPASVPPTLDPFARLAPTWVLRPGQVESLRLRVRRRGSSPYPTRILVTAFTATEGVRWNIPVQLPAPREFELGITGTTGSWTSIGDHWSLHPFPNHRSHFRLALRNPVAREKRVDVRLYVPRRPLPADFPSSSLSLSDADSLLRSLDLASPAAEAKNLSLPIGGSWVDIPFLPPEEEPPAPVEAVDSSGGQPPSNPPTPEHRVVDSLLVVVTDLDQQRRTLTRFEVAPQKPTRFLRPRVGYNPTRQRLEIEVEPQDRDLLPPEGVQVRAEFSPPLPDDGERRVDTIVASPGYRGRMYAEIPAESEKTVTLFLHVDDYPRAFIYQVPCDQLTLDILPDIESLRVHIAELPRGTVYSVPAERIPVQLEVDVPRGAFQRQGDFVEVGIDRRRDRELTGDSTVRIHSDRRVVVTLADAGPDGILTLDTRVSDLQVNIADSSRQSGRVNVLARVMVGGTEAWSEPVDVILDGSGPRFTTAELETDPIVAMGSEVGVTARVDDGQLSGVARVEAAFDQDRSGRFPSEGSVAAELNPTGAWTASVPTEGLPRGAFNLLLRATDRVGNESELRKIRVQVVPEEELRPSGDALRGDIEGTVLFGRAPQASIRVRLARLPDEKGTGPPPSAPAGDVEGEPVSETRTDASGRFAFRKLPVGSYRIEAEGVVFNKPRLATATVRLTPPQTTAPVELKLP